MTSGYNTGTFVPHRRTVRTALASAVQHVEAERGADGPAVFERRLIGGEGCATALHHLGIVQYQRGRSGEALALIGRTLALEPGNAHAHSDRAVILMALGRHGEALEDCRQAVAADPGCAAVQGNFGALMLRLGRPDAAERAFTCALALVPDFAEAHAGRAEALALLGRLPEADAACAAALRLAPDLPQALGAKGLIFSRQGRPTEAAAAFEAALRLDPGAALLHARLGNVHHAAGRFTEALTAYDRAIAAEPETAEFHCNRALALQELGRLDQAQEAFFRALTLKPDFAEAFARLGVLLHRTGRTRHAITALRKAVELAPGNSAAWLNLAGVLKEADQLAEAADAYRALLALGDGPMPVAQYEYCQLRRHLCDWEGLETAERIAVSGIKAGGKRVPPFGALAMACGPAEHAALAGLWAAGFAAPAIARSQAAPLAGRRIRLGYLSCDFHDHATASLVAELFELHDRTRFEVSAYCYGPDDSSAMRRRLMAAFDRFTIVRGYAHEATARQIADDGVDVLVDLKGFTRGACPQILAHRPAPVQVNFLGYPGTMAAPFIDYFIADPIALPMTEQRFYAERIVHLPGCYQPNDRNRRTAADIGSRRDHCLPERAFVFCAFNSVYKITAEVFGIWMRLLGQVPSSVLWLLDANPVATANLRREAGARGIDPARLVFAPKRPMPEHQARYALADLFLDNMPVGAHTTASEALWAGLPVVTCMGESFAGRVAASLVHACGLAELATRSLGDYEALALRLAQSPTLLTEIRAKLAADRLALPLFDTARYAGHLEAAFAHMMTLHETGCAPEAFAVADLPGG